MSEENFTNKEIEETAPFDAADAIEEPALINAAEAEVEPPKFEWASKEDVTPFDIYRLARNILIAVAIIFLASMTIYCFLPMQGAIIFDACKTILPPIATLVIGYYFGERDR